MRHASFVTASLSANLSRYALVALATVALAACGGGGGFNPEDAPALRITSTAISEAPSPGDTNSLYESTDFIDWAIPLSGGWGGPYVVSVIQGRLPDGIGIADGISNPGTTLHNLRGTILESGVFDFRIQVVDRGNDPFYSTYADFHMDVAVGTIKIVGATQNGVGAFYDVGEHVVGGVVQNPIYPAIKTLVLNAFTAIDLTVAGGVAPYAAEVYDDPANPDDNGYPPTGNSLPDGMGIPTASTSIIGSPQATRPGNGPWIFSIRVSDSLGNSSFLTMQIIVDTPPIIITTTALGDAQCGRVYADAISVSGGVPPFDFELVQCDVNRLPGGAPDWQAGQTPAPACCTVQRTAADYPAQTNNGPDYRPFTILPEGMYFGDITGSPYAGQGSIAGIPRRRGQFRMVVHVQSHGFPTSAGQQNWKVLDLNVTVADPFSQDPSYTVPGVFSASQPYSDIPEHISGTPYNPDVATHPDPGLLFKAFGGVTKDGLNDAPNASQLVDVSGPGPAQELIGGVTWALDPNPAGDGDFFTTMPAGMAFDTWSGVWRVANAALVSKQGTQAFEATALDQALPLSVQHTDIRRVNFSIGPETVVITESTNSCAATYYGGVMQNDWAQTVRMAIPGVGTLSTRSLLASDLAKTTTVPNGVALATLLSNVDFLRCAVNANTWADDTFGLNPGGAREFKHADQNRGYYVYAESYGSYPWNVSTSATELPACSSPFVTHTPSSGIFTNGGRMYVFSSASYFGVLIIRSDGSLYVPCCFTKGTYYTFGDHVEVAYGNAHNSICRLVNMAVSPDGRFAAMKLKKTETTFTETANNTPIVVFSLTGEKGWASGTATYNVIANGGNGSTSLGTYLYATSLHFTNSHLYYIVGDYYGSSYSDAYGATTSWQGHHLYRASITNPSTGVINAALTTGTLLPSASGDANWTNASSVPMQTPFQRWSPHTQSWSVYEYPSGATNTVLGPYYYDDIHFGGGNMREAMAGRTPFRASKNGRAMAILAGSGPAAGSVYSSYTDALNHFVWVDWEGAGVRRVSTVKRHCYAGASRGTTLDYGPDYYPIMKRYTGPSTGFEISDDGTKIAVIVNRYPTAGTVNLWSVSTEFYSAREDIIAYRDTGGATPWNTSVEIQVTGDDVLTNPRAFGGTSGSYNAPYTWRMGSLIFTADNKGLVFWAGMSQYYSQSSVSYQYGYPHIQCGSYYGCDVSTPTGGTSGVTVTSIQGSSDGGQPTGSGTNYTTSSPYTPSTSAGGSTSNLYGITRPVGGFMSKNRNFYYICHIGGLTTSDATTHRLLGINVRSVNTAASINGNTDFRAFLVGGSSGWPSRRGFMQDYYPYGGYYGIYYYYVGSHHTAGCGNQTMGSNGNVYWFAKYQANGPTSANGSYSYQQPYGTYYSYDYGYGAEIYAFQADCGGTPVVVTNFNTPTGTRQPHCLDVSANGENLSWVFDSYAYYNYNCSYEGLQFIKGVKLDPTTGNLLSTPTVYTLENVGTGRVSDSVGFHSGGDKLYYAFATAANENTGQLTEARVSGPSTVTKVRPTTQKRYEVLFAGR